MYIGLVMSSILTSLTWSGCMINGWTTGSCNINSFILSLFYTNIKTELKKINCWNILTSTKVQGFKLVAVWGLWPPFSHLGQKGNRYFSNLDTRPTNYIHVNLPSQEHCCGFQLLGFSSDIAICYFDFPFDYCLYFNSLVILLLPFNPVNWKRQAFIYSSTVHIFIWLR